MTDDRKRIEEIRSAPYGSLEGRKADVEFLLTQIDKRDEALRFYADARTWNYDSEVDKPTVNPWETRAGKDQGKLAREALGEE